MTTPKGQKIFLIISIIVGVILMIIIGKMISSTESFIPPKAEISIEVCRKDCKWDAGYWKFEIWLYSPKYFLTRSACIDWCLQLNEI